MNAIRRIFWKWQGRRAYYARERLCDSYSCGNRMVDEVTGGEFSRLTRRVEYCVDKMKAVDGNGRRHTDS